jgi:hypothetical protein
LNYPVRYKPSYQRGDPMAVSKAAQKSSKKYHDEVNDNILVRFPKGTKERIQSTGKSVNGYINESVKEKLERDGK